MATSTCRLLNGPLVIPMNPLNQSWPIYLWKILSRSLISRLGVTISSTLCFWEIEVLNKQKFHVRQLKTNHRAVSESVSLNKPITGVFPEKNKPCYGFCKADYASRRQSMISEPFRPVCWSNPNALVDEWENWISGLVQKFVPRRTKHRANLPPWVTPGTSHLIKKLATKRKFLPEGNGKL